MKILCFLPSGGIKVHSLILKDLMLQRRTWLFPFFYGFFLFIVFNDPLFKNFIYNMGAIAVSYVMIMTAVSFDEKNTTDIILVSLPLNRRKVILEKYLLVFIVVPIGLLIMGFLGVVFKLSGLIEIPRLVNINDFLFSLSSVLLLSAVYYPTYLKLGYRYSRYINLGLFLFLFFLPWLTEYLVNNVDKTDLCPKIAGNIKLSSALIGCVLLLITLILAFIFYLISVRIYMKKNFKANSHCRIY